MLLINKKYLIADKYGNTPLSLAIEEGNIEKVRKMYEIYSLQKYSDAELLKKIAFDMMNHNENYGLSSDVYSKIYSEAKYQLGEDTTEVINAYNV